MAIALDVSRVVFMTDEQKEQIQDWGDGTQFVYRAHYESAVRLQRANLWLGIPTAILSGLVGTSVFATLNEQPVKKAQIAVGLISILVAILASLQTFLRFAERAEKHKEAGARFAALHREADQALVLPPPTDQELKKWMDSFRERWDALSREAPTANRRIWERARAQMLKERQQRQQQQEQH